MKKLYFIFSALLHVTLFLNAQTTKTFILTIDKNDFSVSSDDKAQTFITSSTLNSYFKEDTSQPALPYITVNYLIPPEKIYQSFNSQTSRNLYLQNITMAPNPQILTTTQTGSYTSSAFSLAAYSAGIYPNSNIKYIGVNEMDGYKFISFEICPFVYNASTKQLDILTQIKLTITFSSNILASYPERKGVMDESVKQIVQNSEEMENLYPKATSQILGTNNRIEYLIITSSALSSYFTSLAKWKTIKGVPTKIITTDEIYSRYAGATSQIKIKRCIQDYYLNYHLKYVLLGGDDQIIPVQRCYGKVNSEADSTIPTDLFYACFDKNFDWNANGNNIIGETSDNIDMAPEIYISRLPIRNNCAYMTHVINYEKNGYAPSNMYGAYYKLLLAGVKLWSQWNGRSDAAHKSEKLYNEYIKPNINKSVFYDCGTTSDIGDKDLTAENLQSRLSHNQYLHLHMLTHGNQTAWGMESGINYNSYMASSLSIPSYYANLFITTTACLTNAFDQTPNYPSEPCLSEAFIRNNNNTILGYWGSSRYGWDYMGTSALGPSLQYNAKFYEHLFKNTDSNTHYCTFGEAIGIAKSFYISQCQTDGAMRWLQFSLNAIGDPEIPIYRAPINMLTNTTCQWIGNTLMVNTGVIGCRITGSSINTPSYYQITDNSQYALFVNPPSDLIIWVTKPNCLPKNIAVPAKNANMAARTTHTIQNPETEHGIAKLYPCHPVTWGESAFIICYVPKEAGSATIHLYDAYGKIIKKEFIPEKEKNTTIIPTGELAPGVYLYTLVIDGRQIDTKRLIIK